MIVTLRIPGHSNLRAVFENVGSIIAARVGVPHANAKEQRALLVSAAIDVGVW